MARQDNATEAQRQALRQALLARRRAIPAAELDPIAAAVAERVLPHIECPATVAGYLAFGKELSVTALMTQLREQGCTTAVPIVEPASRLRFTPFDDDTPTKKNSFGIDEPDVPPDLSIPREALDVVLVPLVGFDRALYRMGMGGGYYDRFFAPAADRAPSTSSAAHSSDAQAGHMPTLIGIACECQLVDSVLPAEWDIRLDMIATEARLFTPPGD
ncbi:MAG: 5-formyltetrahydrofolate cyclo-ligase [Gammaproteobacteria bacterium]|nr:MAG: 5-formyltetrahydrofolate cyclo-ligase [Gammaproteobacteria bacterium]